METGSPYILFCDSSSAHCLTWKPMAQVHAVPRPGCNAIPFICIILPGVGSVANGIVFVIVRLIRVDDVRRCV